VKLYAESSALIAWFFGESRAADVRRALDVASAVVTSELTLLEVERSLIRNVVAGRLSAANASRIRVHAATATAGWSIVPISAQVLDAARERFPAEPVRSLDAIHLGTLVVARSSIPDIGVLTLDDRVRENARLMGFTVLP
jgi:predicted nucleic acid-binding protein